MQIDDADYEEELGLRDLPTLVQFSNDIPNIYQGEESKDAVMEWLVKVSALEDFIAGLFLFEFHMLFQTV